MLKNIDFDIEAAFWALEQNTPVLLIHGKKGQSGSLKSTLLNNSSYRGVPASFRAGG